jgi:uncharacterized protein (DUF305 family)
MPNEVATSKSHRLPRFRGVCRESRLRRYFSRTSAATLGLCFAAISPLGLFPTGVLAQEATSGSGGRAAAASVVVQPGAPGQPTKTLPASTHASLPPLAHSDVEFMQGMIMHHTQAVEMTAMIPSHTANQALGELGARISSSQQDEIKFMQRWLAQRGQATSMPGAMAGMPGMDKDGGAMALMPGMLTAEQMDALRHARGPEFDHLFLTGMIQHHNGALIMVKDLFNTAGAGQDADIFNFATDADNTQRAEIKIMQGMLQKETGTKTSEEKR